MEHQEREDRLLNIARLVRAKCYIRDFRNQALLPVISRKVQEAYANCMKLREVVKILSLMENNKHRETYKEKTKRCACIYTKNKLIEDIEQAIKFLMSHSNLLNTRSSVVSILEDLNRATILFKIQAMNCTAELDDEELQEDSSQNEELKKDSRKNEESQEDLSKNAELQENLSKNEKLQEDFGQTEKLQYLVQTEELQEDSKKNEELQEDLSKNAELEEDLSKNEELQKDLSKNAELQEDLSKNEKLQEDFGQTEELQKDLSKNSELQESATSG